MVLKIIEYINSAVYIQVQVFILHVKSRRGLEIRPQLLVIH